MSEALKYAIKIIEGYELEIRVAIADGLLPAGYCQGVIFKDAIADIQKMSDEELVLRACNAVSVLSVALAVAPAAKTRRKTMSRKLKIDQIHIIPRVGGGEDMIIESDEGGGTLFEDIKITGYGFGSVPDGNIIVPGDDIIFDRAMPVMVHFVKPEEKKP